MSKHFELLQQMEKDQTARAVADHAPADFSSVRESREATSVPRNGAVPAAERWASADALRLVQQVILLQSRETPRTIVFAGIEHGNGCSEVCAAVAETLAMVSHRSVCLVEGNFRSPGLTGMFSTNNHVGLTDALVQDAPIRNYTKLVFQDNLSLLSSGAVAADSPSLLSSEQLQERLSELRQEFDFVLIDAPPLALYADAVVLSQMSDGVVLVLEADSTRREAASAAAASLRAVGVPILAAVLNKQTLALPEGLFGRV